MVLHTDGAERVAIHAAGHRDEVPVPSVTVVDTIGAGDAFGGAFAAWWDQAGLGRDDLGDRSALRAATTAAVEVAALSCTRAGSQPPHRADLAPRWLPSRT